MPQDRLCSISFNALGNLTLWLEQVTPIHGAILMKGGVKHRLRITQNGWHGNFSALLVKWSSFQCNPEDKFSQRMCNYQTTQAACNYLTSDWLFSIQSPFLSSSESTCLEFGHKEKLHSCNLALLIFLPHPFQYWWDVSIHWLNIPLSLWRAIHSDGFAFLEFRVFQLQALWKWVDTTFRFFH